MVRFSQLTTLEIGGPIKNYQLVKTDSDFLEALQLASRNDQQFLVVGGGSNLLVSDDGYDGLVIHNQVVGIKQQENSLTVQAGTPLQAVIDFSIEHGLAGIEKLTGIPGTVGGAIYGNAGAYGQTVSDHLTTVKCWNGQSIVTLNKADCDFSYRESNFKTSHFVILEATFELQPGDSHQLKQTADQTLTKRQQKYLPGIKCPGSFFKNILVENLSAEVLKLIPQDKDYYGKVPAWIFLDAIGAKGQQQGQVKVADFHGNLIMNLGQGKASDFWKLAKTLNDKVEAKFGVKLEPEVQLVNLPAL